MFAAICWVAAGLVVGAGLTAMLYELRFVREWREIADEARSQAQHAASIGRQASDVGRPGGLSGLGQVRASVSWGGRRVHR
jgi:hypothetical protein